MPLGPLCARVTRGHALPCRPAPRASAAAAAAQNFTEVHVVWVSVQPLPSLASQWPFHPLVSERKKPSSSGGRPTPPPRGRTEDKSEFPEPAGALPIGNPALRAGVGVVSRQHPLPRPTASQRLSGSGRAEGRRDLITAHACTCAESMGAAHEPAPSKSSVSSRPHLPTSSAWRRRCVRRGLPRVLSAGAAHWSLVLEAAVLAAAPPSAPPPPPCSAATVAAAVVRGLSSGPLRFPPSSAISPSAPTSSGAAGNMRLRSRRPASD